MRVSDQACLGAFLRSTGWGAQLSAADFDRVHARSTMRRLRKGERLVTAGEPARSWVGMMTGSAVQAVTDADGCTTFLSAGSDGTWFGEGTLIRRGRWMYDAITLRESTAVYVPLEVFEHLRSTSIPFNHFLQECLNDRLAHFIGLAVISRHHDTLSKISSTLGSLLDANRNPAEPSFIRITQTDIAMLAGTSRQRANVALARLREEGVIATRHSGIEVRDPPRLLALASGAT
jgi:CRP-like cAMP-binding protein